MAEIRLRRFEPADFRRLIGWIPSAEALVQWAGPIFRFPLDMSQADDYLAPARGTRPSRHVYAALLRDRDEVVGHIDLSDVDPENRRATVCRVLIDPERRGQGLGVAMVEALAGFGFEELGLHRLHLHVFDFNSPAIACYERVGFVREGLLRDWIRVAEGYWSVIPMGLLEGEWREKRSKDVGQRRDA